jgi:hypothetical protein
MNMGDEAMNRMTCLYNEALFHGRPLLPQFGNEVLACCDLMNNADWRRPPIFLSVITSGLERTGQALTNRDVERRPGWP